MPRIRSLKPGFFKNEVLCELSPWHRLLFSGLWLLADREGRLEDRPKRIKVEIFPYETFTADEMEAMLEDLAKREFIKRYEVNGERYLCMPNFSRHQLVSRDEPGSDIPGPDGETTLWEKPPNETVRAAIYQRDGYTCKYCDLDMAKSPRMRCVDHVIPYSRGGSHAVKNLVTACKPCNQRKWAHTPTEVQMPWPEGFGATRPDYAVSPTNDTVEQSNTVNPLGEELGNGELVIGELEFGTGQVVAPSVPAAPSVCRAQDLVDAWNENTHPPIPRCREITKERRRKIQARMQKRPELSEWRDVFHRIQGSGFCRGEVAGRNGNAPWVADFDWIIANDTNAAKVIEGKYDDRSPHLVIRGPTRSNWQDNCDHSPRCGSPTTCQNLKDIAAYKSAHGVAG